MSAVGTREVALQLVERITALWCWTEALDEYSPTPILQVVHDSAGNEDDSLLDLDTMFMVDSIMSEEVVSVCQMHC
jgi:hypothetical protein